VVKCPACGFESPDPAQWCDFCKEPLRRERRAAPAPDQKAGEPKKGIPAEFLALDTGGTIAHAPSWLRYAAWSVLAAWFVVVMALLGAYLARQSAPASEGGDRDRAPEFSSRTAQQQDRPAGQPPRTR